MRRSWTKKEERFIRDNFPDLSTEEISVELKRTETSVKGKVARLGLKSGYYWTEEEVDYLKNNYKTKTYQEISDVLGRELAAIRAKIHKMDIPPKKRGVDLNGHTFGKLRVVKKTEKRNDKGSVIWLCICSCGEDVEVPTSQLTTNKRQSCGCIRKNMVGINHPAYNPSLTEYDRRNKRYSIGASPNYNLNKKAFERDSFTCQHCRKVGGDLNAHHLNSWNTHKDQRFDLNNLVTLCIECHSSFHKVFGYGNNTTQQFEEFKILRKEV